MAHKVAFRPAAYRDLEEIDDYIAQDSPARARAFVLRIMAHCMTLADFPEAGPRRDEWRPGLRLLPYGKRVVIAYTIEGSTVQIGRIFYGGRDVETLLRDPGKGA